MNELSKKRGRIESDLRNQITILENCKDNQAAWDRQIAWIGNCIQRHREVCYEEAMNGCTGYVSETGSIVHDGDTCPHHESDLNNDN